MKTPLILIFISFNLLADGITECRVHPNAMGGGITASNRYTGINALGEIADRHDTSYSSIPDDASTSSGAGLVDRQLWLEDSIKQPIYLPFRARDNTRITAAWLYTGEKRHNALDFAPLDTDTFLVTAVADGVVVWNAYSPSAGNVVVIEHTALNGDKFRSIYHHLRDGRDRDIARARLTNIYANNYNTDWKDSEAAKAYQNQADTDFSNLSSPNPSEEMLTAAKKYWGSVVERIQVQTGDFIKAGQPIAYAGRTGVHQNGVHLHLMFAKPGRIKTSSGLTSKKWVFFDPYGHYAISSKCYSTEAMTQFNFTNQFAPAFEEFIDLDAKTFSQAFRYFAKRGYGPQTLSANGMLLSGAFAAMSHVPLTRVNRPLNVFLRDLEEARNKNARPKIMAVHSHADQTTYSAIWTTNDFNEHFTSPQMSLSEFKSKFKQYFTSHQLSDYVLYVQQGRLWVSGTWIKKPSPSDHAMYLNLTESTFKEKHRAFEKKGLKLIHIQRYEHPGKGERLSGLWIKSTTEHIAHTGLSRQRFQDLSILLKQAGYAVHYVTSFNDKIDAIYRK